MSDNKEQQDEKSSEEQVLDEKKVMEMTGIPKRVLNMLETQKGICSKMGIMPDFLEQFFDNKFKTISEELVIVYAKLLRKRFGPDFGVEYEKYELPKKIDTIELKNGNIVYIRPRIYHDNNVEFVEQQKTNRITFFKELEQSLKDMDLSEASLKREIDTKKFNEEEKEDERKFVKGVIARRQQFMKDQQKTCKNYSSRSEELSRYIILLSFLAQLAYEQAKFHGVVKKDSEQADVYFRFSRVVMAQNLMLFLSVNNDKQIGLFYPFLYFEIDEIENNVDDTDEKNITESQSTQLTQ